VPYAVCGTRIKSDNIDRFCESSAELGSMKFMNGHELLPYLLKITEN
jgi:2,3-bisphosphoglycerate-independent phosphoglycerate mutase